MAESRTYTYEYVIGAIIFTSRQYGLDSSERDQLLQSAKWTRDATWLNENQRQYKYLKILETCQSYIDEARANNPVNIIAGALWETLVDIGEKFIQLGERALAVGNFLTQPWLVVILGIILLFFIVFLIVPRIRVGTGGTD